MQIAQLQHEKSIAEIVTRVYGLKVGDPRVPAAGKALAAANPHLGGNLAALPAGTPVVVPAIEGIAANASAITDPKQATWIAILDKLVDAAQQASNAQSTGLATTSPKSPDAERVAALTTLGNDIAQFKKLHNN
jgi:hypothetical protein